MDELDYSIQEYCCSAGLNSSIPFPNYQFGAEEQLRPVRLSAGQLLSEPLTIEPIEVREVIRDELTIIPVSWENNNPPPLDMADPFVHAINPQSPDPLDIALSEAASFALASLSKLRYNSEGIANLKKVISKDWNADRVHPLIEELVAGDGLPTIEIWSLVQLKADGAFSIDTNTIYLADKFVKNNINNTEAIAEVIIEEAGHYLDSLLNPTADTPGDEGAIFAAVVLGYPLNEQELLALKAENDITTVTLNGETIQIEQSSEQSDLVVSEVDITPKTVTWGESAQLTWTVTNQGSGTALSNWYDGIYLSSDPVFDSGDTFVSNRRIGSSSSLASGESYTASTIVTIPRGSGITGKPYLLVVADYYQNYAKESDESNNATAASTLITHPDLVVTEVNIPEGVSWGQSGVEVSWEVTNQGTGTALTNWYDGIYLSSDPVFDSGDTFVSNRRIESSSSLGSGESYTASLTVTIPRGSGITGKPYLLVVADYYQNLEKESDESNNATAASTLITHSDLVVTSVNIPEGVSWG